MYDLTESLIMRTSTRVGALVLLAYTAASIGGCGEASGPPGLCEDPAPLNGSLDPAAPGVIVMYGEGTDAAAVTSRLAERYDFTPRHVWSAGVLGFSAELSPTGLEGVRCESRVASVSYNSRIVITDG